MKCKYCDSQCIKKGFQKNGTQKFQCVECKKYQQEAYMYKAYLPDTLKRTKQMIKRGLGVLDMSCLLEIGKNTVIRYIQRLSKEITIPKIREIKQVYEADEFHTVIRGEIKQDVYVGYVMNRNTKGIMSFCIGTRDKISLGEMLKPVLAADPMKIYTDGLVSCKSIIPKEIHERRKYRIQRIERNHLTIRTRMKRVSRNFMNHSRSLKILTAYLKIYFWG